MICWDFLGCISLPSNQWGPLLPGNRHLKKFSNLGFFELIVGGFSPTPTRKICATKSSWVKIRLPHFFLVKNVESL